MAKQVRTLTFLPEIFQTETNSHFLESTLDVLTNKPNLSRVQGYVGEKHGYGVTASDKYVAEPTAERTNYQLEPSVVFLKKDTKVAQDFIDYPGIINALEKQGANVSNHNKLFSNEFYTWDSFTDLDKTVNYTMYYWLPLGPDAILITEALDIDTIIGQQQYTTPSGLKFINGLKVNFVNPVQTGMSKIDYYVEGVGTSITLLPADEMISTEVTAGGMYVPYDKDNFDTTVWSIKLYVPIQPDYITINRNSEDRNAWSRGNRWFHQRVLDTTEEWNGQITRNPSNTITRAQRPIIEFEGNIRLFNSGTKSAGAVDYIDTYTTNAQVSVSGAAKGTAEIVVTLTDTTTITNGYFTVASTDKLTLDQAIVFKATPGVGSTYVDNYGKTIAYETLGGVKLSTKTYYISKIDRDNNGIQLTDITGNTYPKAVTHVKEVIPSMTLTNVATVQSGARVVFAADDNPAVRSKIYNISYTSTSGDSVAVMADTGATVTDGTQVHVSDGPGDLNGTSWRYSSTTGGWIESQKKVAINQAPRFDIFDTNEISLGDSDFYPATTFKGTKIFSYAPGVGTSDSVLGFPVAYSSGETGADFEFRVDFNYDTFTYTKSGTKTTALVSIGYVHTGTTNVKKRIGWTKAIAPSKQYQLFSFDTTTANQTDGYVCDILANTRQEVTWSPAVVFNDGEFVDPTKFTVVRDAVKNTTTIKLSSTADIGSKVTVSLLSDQVSSTAYYQIPANLQNNAFNVNMTAIALGEVKQHYVGVFNNAPGSSGPQLGSNNYSDLGDLTKYGNRIIQNSASLLLPGVFLRKAEYNLHDALRFNAEKYQEYKNRLVDLAEASDYSVYQTPEQILDDIISRITANKLQTDSFFWSDMVMSGSPYVTNTYEYRTDIFAGVIPLSHTYDTKNANYEGFCVYYQSTVDGRLVNELLIRGIDYNITDGEPSIVMTRTILAGDKLVVKEYNQTYGSYCPNTPTKLGMYPATTPKIVTDYTFIEPTQFIVGHDGSMTKMYGQIVNGRMNDFRDVVLFEFEKRVFNNLKVSGELPLTQDDLMPGQWRTTKFTWEDILGTYSENFLDWAGKNRVNYRRQFYNKLDNRTFNYNKATNRIDGTLLKQGGWRGIYRWFYDTTNPSQAPWEMLGITDKPLWWDERYGLAPYTSGNTLMWEEISRGIVWNHGNPFVVSTKIRPDLLKVLPVDSEGKQLFPQDTVVGNYDINTFKRDWFAGDGSPAEEAYRRSSTWAFDLMKLLSTFEPVRFYNYFADRDNYKYNSDNSQFLFKERYHLSPSLLDIYGTDGTTAKHSYMNWVVDYNNQSGKDGAAALHQTLQNLDVRLTYRLAGFSDKEYLKFFTENSTPSATSANLLIPDDSFDLILYDNVADVRIEYSSVIIQKNSLGYTVWGNSMNAPHFKTVTPLPGPTQTISVDASSVEVTTEFDSTRTVAVAYGTQYYTETGVSEFLMNYGRYLETTGVTFEQVKSGKKLDWKYSIEQFLYWAQQSWEDGSTINLNPAATKFTAYKEGLVVQPLTLRQSNFVLNQNLLPVDAADLAVSRYNQSFGVTVLSEGDTIAYTNLNMSAVEHAIIFNNETLFGDVIYNNETGNRQSRVILQGRITANWTGGVTAEGFILNEGDIEEWNTNSKYPKGQIVTYKNLYWVAQSLIEASNEFDYTLWKQSSYDQIKVGLLPNPTTLAYDSVTLYDINMANLDSEADLLAFGLIGYRPRTYMSETQLSDITQVNIYRGMIPMKGTNKVADALIGATTAQGTLDYSIRENWAIKRGEFGSVLNTNYAEVLLDGGLLTANPSIIGFSDGTVAVDGAHQTITVNPYNLKGTTNYVNDLINYGRAPKDNEFLPLSGVTTSQQRGLPTAGYVNIDDVKYVAYTLDDLNLNSDAIDNLYRDDVVWIANHRGEWDVFTPVSQEINLLTVTNNFDGTATLKFSKPHTLVEYDAFYVIEFDSTINGYYMVDSIPAADQVTVSKSLAKSIITLTGTGVVFKLVSKRVTHSSELSSYKEIVKYGQYSTHRNWVDTSTSGEWQVLANGPVYLESNLDDKSTGITNYGLTVAYSSKIGQLVADGAGNLYLNNVLLANRKAGIGADTKLIVDGYHAYCSSPTEGLIYVYDFSGSTLSAKSIVAGNKYTISTLGTTNYVALGATPRWTNVQAYFTPEQTATAPLMIVTNANGHTIEAGTYLSGNNITPGTYITVQTHRLITTTPTSIEVSGKGKQNQQSVGLTNVTGIRVGDWVVNDDLPLGTYVQSINTYDKVIVVTSRFTKNVAVGTPFTFYRPISANVETSTFIEPLHARGIYRVSEATPVAGLTNVNGDQTSIQVVGQPAEKTSFLATVSGGTNTGTGTVTQEYTTIDTKVDLTDPRLQDDLSAVTLFDGFLPNDFAISQDNQWLYVSNKNTNEVKVFINEVGKFKPVSKYKAENSFTNGAITAGWGTTIDTPRDGSKLIVGAPEETVDGSDNAGATYIYARLTENFLQSDRALKIVPYQTYSIEDMGDVDATSLEGWFDLGAGVQFRARITKDDGYIDNTAWKSGTIMTVGDATYGIKDTTGASSIIRIGSYLSGYDPAHSVGDTQDRIVAGTTVVGQFDSYETDTLTAFCDGANGSSEITFAARSTPAAVSVGQIVCVTTRNSTTPFAINHVSKADYEDSTKNSEVSKIQPDTYVAYIKNNVDYHTVSLFDGTSHSTGSLTKGSDGKIYKAKNTTTMDPVTDTTFVNWSQVKVTVGLTRKLTGQLASANNEVSFRAAGRTGRYIVSEAHNFSGAQVNHIAGSVVTAISKDVPFVARGYGSIVKRINGVLSSVDKTGTVSLRKDFIINDVVPNNKVIVYIDNKLVPLYTIGYRNGRNYRSYNYKITVNTLLNQTKVSFTKTPPIGSVVVIDFGKLILQQRTQSAAPRVGAQYGHSVATNNWGAEVFTGAPYEISDINSKHNIEGAVYRWTNVGQRYNNIVGDLKNLVPNNAGTYDVDANIYIDGFLVNIKFTGEASKASVAERIAKIIDTTEPTNVIASSNGTTFTIYNGIPGTTNDQVDITGDLDKIGITPYIKTQTIVDTINYSTTAAFGYTIAVNKELNSTRDALIVSAPYTNVLAETTFDFIDDLRDDDTIYDNGGTTFVDRFTSIGGVYEYDYLASDTETPTNPGIYTFGQYVNHVPSETAALRANTPRYGQSLNFNDGTITVGSPLWYRDGTGRVSQFTTTTYESCWYVDKAPLPKVDVNKLVTVAIYDTNDGTALSSLDYIDPAQGKHLAAVNTNLDFIGATDPASYTTGIIWNKKQVGKTWMDTTNFRLMNYNQPDLQYNARYFGQTFPGSTADIYTWIESDVEPMDYQGSGYVVSMDAYTAGVVFDRQSNTTQTKYYYWVKNYGDIPHGKTLAPTTIASYVLDPLNSGIQFLGALSTNSIALFNARESITENTSALHVGYSESDNDDVGHQDWLLIQTNNKDSFLPGVPLSIADAPSGLYLKYLTSFMGHEIDTETQLVRKALTVPDENLSILTRYGVSFRPRQTMFLDRELALKNYIDYANQVLASEPITETRGTFLLNKSGSDYDTADFWTVTDWWATGYSSSTKPSLEVDTYNTLLTIGSVDPVNADSTGIVTTLSDGLVARVKKNGQGLYETYRYTSSAGWSRINLENGTIAIKDTIYTQTSPIPSQEIYWIIRWLTEQVFVDDLSIENNNSLIMMFNFIQSDSPQGQNYLPWLNKTSLVDIQHTIRQLLPYKKFQIQSSTLINGYINEVKPFHVYVKEFSYKYTATETFEGDITDFDLPAKFRSSSATYVTPRLIQKQSESLGEYTSTDGIWSESEYANWFKYHGLSYTNDGVGVEESTVVPVTQVIVDITSSAASIYVESVAGLPVSGTVKINGEEIWYESVNRSTNSITGLVRTTGSTHASGSIVSLITKPVMVMETGRGYLAAPIVTAWYDTTDFPYGPTVTATFMTTMKNGGLTVVDVVEEGRGYPTTPELRVSMSSIVSTFTSGQVDTQVNQFSVGGHQFVNGDSVVFVTDSTDSNLALRNYGNYYVGALDGESFALYETYREAMASFTTTEPIVRGRAAGDNYHFYLSSPYDYSTPMFVTGDLVKLRTNVAGGTITDPSYNDAFEYYYAHVDESIDTTGATPHYALYDYVTFHTSHSDAMSGAHPVEFAPVGDPNAVRSNEFCIASRTQRVDDGRVTIGAKIDGTVGIAARLQAYHGNRQTRGIRTAMKFDRITYKTSVFNWESGVNRFQEMGWDVTTWSKGTAYSKGDLVVYNGQLYRASRDTIKRWEVSSASPNETISLWTPGTKYAVDKKVLYSTIIYKCTEATTDKPTDGDLEVFSLANFTEVASDDPLITAADRIVGFYRPTSDMPGSTYADLSQLMTGTTYPYQTIIDPEFTWGETYAFLPRNVDTEENTVTLNNIKPLLASYQEVVYGTYTTTANSITQYHMASQFTPAVTETNLVGNSLSVSGTQNLHKGMPIRFIGDMIQVYTNTIVNGTIVESVANAFYKDTTYFIANVDASNSSIQISYNQQLSQLSSISTTASRVYANGMITLDTAIGNYTDATIKFSGSSFGNVSANFYYIDSIDGTGKNVTLRTDVFSSGGQFVPPVSANIGANGISGNMKVTIDPYLPQKNASGYTTLVLGHHVGMIGVANANANITVTVDSTDGLYLNAPVKFGGNSIGNISNSSVYFISNVDVANSAINIVTIMGDTTAVPNVANATGTMTVRTGFPITTVTGISSGNYYVANTTTHIVGSTGNITVGTLGANAKVQFASGSVSGANVNKTTSYYITSANTTTNHITITDKLVGGTTITPSTSTLSNSTGPLYLVSDYYTQPVESSYITGDLLKMYYKDPADETIGFYFTNREANNVISLYASSDDAEAKTNSIAIHDGAYGYLVKPQTVVSAVGPLKYMIGDIVPMTFELSSPTLGFGLTPNKTYWARFISVTTVRLYRTRTDAQNEYNHLPLLKQIGGQMVIGSPIIVDVVQADGSTKIETVGYNEYDSIIVSDNNVTPDYNVAGKEFTWGFGPEELMAGVVSDGVNITVTTRAGSTWDPLATINGTVNARAISDKFGHTGFNMVRFDASANGTKVDWYLDAGDLDSNGHAKIKSSGFVGATTFVESTFTNPVTTPSGVKFASAVYFGDRVKNPVTVEVYAKTTTYGQVKLVEGTDYILDMANKVIHSVSNTYVSISLELVVYEFGNSSHLLRSTSDIYGLQTVGDHSEMMLDVPFALVDLPTIENYWLGASVFVNGVKLEYYDGVRPLFNYNAPMFSVIPQRPFDPKNDPYNPAKIVFNTLYTSSDFASFVLTTNVIGYYRVENASDTYKAPITDETAYSRGKIGVYVNGVLTTQDSDYKVSMITKGSKSALVTITFTSGVVAVGDNVKITYENGGASAPMMEMLGTPTPTTGAVQYDLTGFLGDNNYAPFSDLRVLFDNAASTQPNTFVTRCGVDLADGMSVVVVGDDTNKIIPGFPSSHAADIVTKTYYLRDVVYHSDNLWQDTFGTYTFRLATIPDGQPIVLSSGTDGTGQPRHLTFVVNNDNLIVEIDGTRINGIAPNTLKYGGIATPINNTVTLSYPAPVYSRATFSSSYLIVNINGVPYSAANNFDNIDPVSGASRHIQWYTNYDANNNLMAGSDATFNVDDTLADTGAFFDAGDPFDNQSIIDIVFAYDLTGSSGLISTDIITVEYNIVGNAWVSGQTYEVGDIVTYNGVIFRCYSDVTSATNPVTDYSHWSTISMSPPPVYVVEVNQDTAGTTGVNETSIGGTLTVYAPWLDNTHKVSVTSFGRTTQQYLKTQILSDITVTQVTNVIEITGQPTVVYTGPTLSLPGAAHGINIGDLVMINGTAVKDLDGGNYYAKPIDLSGTLGSTYTEEYTFQLFSDSGLVTPIDLANPGAFQPITTGKESYVQLLQTATNTASIAVNPAVINQSQFNLVDKQRLFVSFTKDSTVKGSTGRYYVQTSKFDIATLDYVDEEGTSQTVYTLILLQPVVPGNLITITSMVPTASPGENRLRMNAQWDTISSSAVVPFLFQQDPANQLYYTSVYREPEVSRTHITAVNSSDSITVANPYALVRIYNYTRNINEIGVLKTGEHYVLIEGITTDEIAQINITDSTGVKIEEFYWVNSGNSSSARIVFTFNPNSKLSIVVAVGNNLLIKGEQLQYRAVELDVNKTNYGQITGIRHARNTTIAADLQPYDIVQSIKEEDLMASSLYNKTWYSNTVTALVDTSGGDVSGTYTLQDSTLETSLVKVGDTLKFSSTSNDFSGIAYVYTGLQAIKSIVSDNGTYVNFAITAYGDTGCVITDRYYYDTGTSTWLYDRPSTGSQPAKFGETMVVSGNATDGYYMSVRVDQPGMAVGQTVVCSAIAYAIREGTTISNIEEATPSKPSNAKIITMYNKTGWPLLKDIPRGTAIQYGTTMPVLAPNAKFAKPGEKIQFRRYNKANDDWSTKIKYYVASVGSYLDVFTVVESKVNPDNPQQWTIKIAEPVTIPSDARAEIAISEFTVTDIVDNGDTTYAVTVETYTDCVDGSGATAAATPLITGGSVTYATATYKVMDKPLQLDNSSIAGGFLNYTAK
jgi:hypothetical protein